MITASPADAGTRSTRHRNDTTNISSPAGWRVKIKYTALLDLDTADAFDELAKVARRRTGKTVGKAEIMRALIMLAANDASLREQLMAALGTS